MIEIRSQKSLILAPDIINQLSDFKRTGETYDDVVNKLVQMNKKYSPILEIFEYVFVTKGNSKVFRIIYENENHTIEYYDQEFGFIADISAWDDSPAISNEDKELFEEFIKREDFAELLYDLDYEYNNNYIFKIRCIYRQGR